MSVKLIYNPIRKAISSSVNFDGNSAVDTDGFQVDSRLVDSLVAAMEDYEKQDFSYPPNATGHEIAAIDDAEAAAIDNIKVLAGRLAKVAKKL